MNAYYELFKNAPEEKALHKIESTWLWAVIRTNKFFIDLPCAFTKEQALEAIHTLKQFNYDAGYGLQELFGTIVFNDKSWLERGEYDGSEWWEHKVLPSYDEAKAEIQSVEIWLISTSPRMKLFKNIEFPWNEEIQFLCIHTKQNSKNMKLEIKSLD